MAVTVHPDVMDSALSVLSSNAQTIVALSSVPSNYADATGAARLADAGMVSGDFSLQDNGSGRQLSISQKNGTASSAGSASAVALLDDTNQRLLFSATIPAVSMSSGDVVQFLSWTITLNSAV